MKKISKKIKFALGLALAGAGLVGQEKPKEKLEDKIPIINIFRIFKIKRKWI